MKLVQRQKDEGRRQKDDPSPSALQPSAFCLQPSAFCLLPSAFSPLPSAFCLLPSAFCLPIVIQGPADAPTRNLHTGQRPPRRSQRRPFRAARGGQSLVPRRLEERAARADRVRPPL